MNQGLDMNNNSRAISRVGIVFFIIWVLLAVILLSDSGVAIISFFVALSFTFIWLIVWLSRFIIVWLSRSKRNNKFKWRDFSSVVFWGFEPIAFLFILVLVHSGTMMLARLYISSSALEQYAKNVHEGKVDIAFEFTHPSRLIGLYSISITDAMPDGGVRFITSGDGLFDKAGFAYYPNGEPPKREENTYNHIYGPWWQWKEGF